MKKIHRDKYINPSYLSLSLYVYLLKKNIHIYVYIRTTTHAADPHPNKCAKHAMPMQVQTSVLRLITKHTRRKK